MPKGHLTAIPMILFCEHKRMVVVGLKMMLANKCFLITIITQYTRRLRSNIRNQFNKKLALNHEI